MKELVSNLRGYETKKSAEQKSAPGGKKALPGAKKSAPGEPSTFAERVIFSY
jgi:hypothetical protein